jgi:hypothetical protein
MSEQLPEPLVPADVDLRDFEFMPFSVARFRDSALVAEREPEEIVAAVLLWSASWHQVPASSLPDNDKQLARLAGYARSVRDFLKVKEGAMHGLMRCSDGRWYHSVVAEKAAEGWNAKVKEEHKRACDRQRKSNKERKERGEPELPIPASPPLLSKRLVDGIPLWRYWNSDGTDGNSDGNPKEAQRKSRLKGEGEGEVRDTHGGKPPNGVPVDPEILACAMLSAALREQGVSVTPDHPDLIAWRKAGVTESLALQAVELAREQKPKPEPIPARYLDRVIRNMLRSSPAIDGRAPADPWAGAR